MVSDRVAGVYDRMNGVMSAARPELAGRRSGVLRRTRAFQCCAIRGWQRRSGLAEMSGGAAETLLVLRRGVVMAAVVDPAD